MIALFVCVVLGQVKVGDFVYITDNAEGYRTAEAAVSRFGGFERPFDRGKVIALKVLEGEKLVRIDSEHYELPMWALERDVKRWDEDARQQAENYREQQKKLAKERIDATKKRQSADEESDRKMRADMAKEIQKSEDDFRIDFFIRTLEPQVREIVENRIEGDNALTREKVKRIAEEARASVANRAKQSELTDGLRPFCITKPEHEALAVAVGKGLDPVTMTAEQAKSLTAGQRRALSQVKARYLKAKKK